MNILKFNNFIKIIALEYKKNSSKKNFKMSINFIDLFILIKF